MLVKNILKVSMILGAGFLAAACSDSASDPGTESKADLNPPGTLWTVTKDKAIELRWTAGNVEEDFNGYYVFAVDASKITDAVKPTYPSGADANLAGVPRCVLNTKFFEAFGFKPTDKDCEDDTATEGGATTAGSTIAGGSYLQEEGAADGAAAEEPTEKLEGFVKCDTGSSADISLVKAPPQVETQVCNVSKLGDGTTALENGKTYAFIVMAARDDRTKVSWTSNLILDTPSAEGLPDGTTVTLGNGQYAKITLDATNTTGELSAVADCPTAAGPARTPCAQISVSNTAADTSSSVYLSRTLESIDGTAQTYKQRLYVSASENSNVKIQARGPQTWDPLAKATANRIPGDEAAATYPGTAGTKYVVYNNQVFDIEVAKDASTIYYGKLVVGDVTYADTANTSDATLHIALILQPLAGTRHYFQTVNLIRQ